MTDLREQAALRDQCTVFLTGHGPVRPADLLAGIPADTVPDREGLLRRMAEMTVLVAEDAGGHVVGTIACKLVTEDEGHLRGMAVLPDWQGAGVAAELLSAVEEELRRRKCRRATLDTTAPLQRAIRFYERNGYRASGRVEDFYGMPLYEYAKALE